MKYAKSLVATILLIAILTSLPVVAASDDLFCTFDTDDLTLEIDSIYVISGIVYSSTLHITEVSVDIYAPVSGHMGSCSVSTAGDGETELDCTDFMEICLGELGVYLIRWTVETKEGVGFSQPVEKRITVVEQVGGGTSSGSFTDRAPLGEDSGEAQGSIGDDTSDGSIFDDPEIGGDFEGDEALYVDDGTAGTPIDNDPDDVSDNGGGAFYADDGTAGTPIDNDSDNDDEVYYYSVRYDANGGGGAPSQETVIEGEHRISTKVPTRSGYLFEGWSTTRNGPVFYSAGDTVYLFDDLTLYAVWEMSGQEHWAKEYIRYVKDLGLIDDLSPGDFGADVDVSRATIVTALFRLSGDASYTKAGYVDVQSTAWYADAVNWAKEHGIANGVSQKEFAPNASITREQMATMLYRFALYTNCVNERASSSDMTRFSDYSSVNSWAKEAITWAVSIGLINGRTEKTLVPQGTATRAEAATLLKRFNESVLAERKVPSECSHSYVDGICELCGELCRHFFDVSACWDHNEPGTQKVVRGSGKWEFNNSSHWVISQTYKCTCTQCGSVIYTDVSYDDAEVQASKTAHQFKYHQFDENSHSIHCACGYLGYAVHSFEKGVCKYCGYERTTESATTSVADSIQSVLNGPLFSDAADYPFTIYEDYANSNGGTALYACLVVDTAENLSDLKYIAESSSVRVEDLNIDLARDLRGISNMIDNMDSSYYGKSVKEASGVLEWIFDIIKGDWENYDTIKDAYDVLSNYIEKEYFSPRSVFNYEYAKTIVDKIQTMQGNDRLVLIHSYENAMNRHVDMEKWIKGMHELSSLLDITKFVVKGAFYIFGDYSEPLEKLTVLKEAAEQSGDKNLVKAVQIYEELCNSALLRALNHAEEATWDSAEAAFGSAWQVVKISFLPVSGIASTCVMFEPITETKNGLATYAEALLAKKQRGKNVDESELREVLHALIDIRLYSCDLAMNLTWNEGTRASLRNLKGKMTDWHRQIDTLVDFWFAS